VVRLKQGFALLWLVYPCVSASADDGPITEVTKHIKTTLAKAESHIRPPLRSHTAVSVESNHPGANTAPFGREFCAADGCERLMQTVPTQYNAKTTGKSKESVLPTSDNGIEVAGVRSQAASVLARNSRYTFNLERAKTADGWLITKLGKNGEPPVAEIEKILTMNRAESLQPVNWLTVLDGTHPLDKLFQAEGFLLSSTSQATPGGPVTIQFTRSFRGKPDTVIDCSYTFDPASDWLPIEWVEKTATPDFSRSMSVSQKVTMAEGRYEANIKVILSSERPEKASVTRKTLHVVETVDRIPDSDFTLPAFGIPEPVEYAARPTPMYVWLLGLAGGCLVLTLGFRLLARRRAV
jgi:hypothetical protein